METSVSKIYEEDANARRQKLSDRKKGVIKKCHELSAICGAKVFLKIVAESGHVYTFATDDLYEKYKTTGITPSETESRQAVCNDNIITTEKMVSMKKKCLF